MIPVVLGAKSRHYVVDHHHLARALHEEGVKDVAVTLIDNLSKLDQDAFWTVMDNRSWMHPFDSKGMRRHYEEIPKRVADLVDDPFRSLAGELRRAGGFAKDTTPFSEFLWADFLRRRMKRRTVEREFERAIEKALRLAKSAWLVRSAGGGLIERLLVCGCGKKCPASTPQLCYNPLRALEGRAADDPADTAWPGRDRKAWQS